MTVSALQGLMYTVLTTGFAFYSAVTLFGAYGVRLALLAYWQCWQGSCVQHSAATLP